MKYFVSVVIILFSLSAKATLITFESSELGGYGSQATSGGYNILDSGNELEVFGNYWATLSSVPVSALDNSILTLEFMTTEVGEVNGIGFDNDEVISNGGLYFDFGGTQTFGNEDFAQTLVAGVWYTIVIDFSNYDLSSYDTMLFIADQDDSGTTDSFFRNLEFTTSTVSVSAPSSISILALFLLVSCFIVRRR
ncbi:hypothetical protein EP12_08350 [Alteromonas australica]|uniref:hypothetical protein n=1 Tax=Alteromonas australica TaxID=589873 RepID=UPI0005C4028A|nr:hypothetical protein [Alteromonas australica]AJP43674.1 hypothetical protein EP12_08350 [Alteromonas australica]|tara:strand:- start:14532 stop:15113 length:582 start_codon:yes stop_codon:yes gene_type:complete